MDIVRFIEERNRMCKSFARGEGCQMCPACDYDLHCILSVESTLDAKEQAAIVEKWSAEHPRKTRQDVFFEQYPEADTDNNGAITICPMRVSATYRDENGCCASIDCECADCCREFWMQEVEEDK